MDEIKNQQPTENQDGAQHQEQPVENNSEKTFTQSELDSIIEKRLNKDGKYKGVTRNYINVVLENSENIEFNTLKRVTLKAINNNKMLGE